MNALIFRFQALFLIGLICTGNALGSSPRTTSLYFASPEESVRRCTTLLRAHDWLVLARYYDLAGSGVAYGDLTSGVFFLRSGPPELADPGGLWKIREPFAPGFTFLSAEASKLPKVVAVTVGIEIDEGGGLIQRGRTIYYLRKSAKGYQLLPGDFVELGKPAAREPAHARTNGI